MQMLLGWGEIEAPQGVRVQRGAINTERASPEDGVLRVIGDLELMDADGQADGPTLLATVKPSGSFSPLVIDGEMHVGGGSLKLDLGILVYNSGFQINLPFGERRVIATSGSLDGIFDRVIPLPGTQTFFAQNRLAVLYTDTEVHLRLSLPGDANLNDRVEQGDLDAVLNNWGRNNEWLSSSEHVSWVTGDFNGDGRVDQIDLDVILNGWGSSVAPNLRSFDVPEPLNALLLVTLVFNRCPRAARYSTTDLT